jgi:hypothetical protein
MDLDLRRLRYFVGVAEQQDTIRDGRVDVGYLRLPADQHGQAAELLLREPREHSASPAALGATASVADAGQR